MYPDQPIRIVHRNPLSSKGKKYRICPLCNRDERTGGAWVDTRNPCFFRDRNIWIRVKKGELEGHALCMLVNTPGSHEAAKKHHWYTPTGRPIKKSWTYGRK